MMYLAWYSEIYMKIMTGKKKVYMEPESYAPVFKALIWKLSDLNLLKHCYLIHVNNWILKRNLIALYDISPI